MVTTLYLSKSLCAWKKADQNPLQNRIIKKLAPLQFCIKAKKLPIFSKNEMEQN